MAEFFSKFLRFIGVEEEDDDQMDYDETMQYPSDSARVARYPEPQPYRQPASGGYNSQTQYSQQQTGKQYQPETASARNKGGKVVQHPSYENSNVKHQTTIYQISEHTEAKAVIDDLLTGKSVLLNLENLDAVESQRVIDTLSGAAYAISAKLRKVAHQTYLIAPVNVEIGGNYADEGGRAASSGGGSIFRSRSE
jgi:cell division inhibitor SepF